ncbi:MAG TPA: cobalamin-binding protein, partial [Ruminococcaceae bacterium]|nr:cobalamin-binding protein [Oscillospiraceae bacterium]
HLVEAGVESKGTAVIGTVKGDLHDIGKNLVRMMLEGKGLNVVDLGVDVSSDQFVQAAIDNNADIICCSALLTTTMGEMKDVVAAAKEKGIRDKVKIMVGGAPITQSFCDSIGADCYTADAASAADAALSFCS